MAIIALIVFGPRRLPEIARSVGKAFSEFRRQANEVRDEFESNLRSDDGGNEAEAMESDLPLDEEPDATPPVDNDRTREP